MPPGATPKIDRVTTRDLNELTFNAVSWARAMWTHDFAAEAKDALACGYPEQSIHQDRAVQGRFLDRLIEICPDTPVIAEESDLSESKAKLAAHTTFVTVDPIDGSLRYKNRLNNWGSMLALVVDGELHFSSMCMDQSPTSILQAHATRGHGTFLRDGVSLETQVYLDQSIELKDKPVMFHIGPWLKDEHLLTVLRLAKSCPAGFSTVSGVCGHIDLLRGGIGAHIFFAGAKIWDVAPGALAVEEAGGYVCDLEGKPLVWDQLNMPAIFAANERIARNVVDLMDTPKARDFDTGPHLLT